MINLFIIYLSLLLLLFIFVSANRNYIGRGKQPFRSNENPTCKDWLWPMPAHITCGTATGSKFTFGKSISVQFDKSSKSQKSDILLQAIDKFLTQVLQPPLLFQRGTGYEPEFRVSPNNNSSNNNRLEKTDNNNDLIIESIIIHIDKDEPVKPISKLSTDDESYKLDVKSPTTTLTANTIWGALYGLTTFKQLVVLSETTSSIELKNNNNNIVEIASVSYEPSILGAPLVTIEDVPRYPWRGLLIDSVNHFLPLADIKRTLNVMAENKLNVLHWHLTDSYSFPFQSQAFPNLSLKGAWHPTKAIYTFDDISDIESYAKYLGIRVVVEVDQPGHAYSWGLGVPGITVPCPSVEKDIGPINVVPFNPILNETYDTITKVMTELATLLPGEHIHLGGDELQYGCWNQTKSIKEWMVEKEIHSFEALTQYFFQRIRETSENILKRKAVVWEDLFLNAEGQLNFNVSTVPFPYDKAIVEVWTSPEYLGEAIKAGYDGILAYGWYLDRQVPVDNQTSWFWMDTWRFMYLNDPEGDVSSYRRSEMDGRDVNKPPPPGTILGGEASMWSEQVDPTSFDGRIWPRACAMAERLWSPKQLRDVEDASLRLNKHRCRLVKNTGIKAGPIWAGYCDSAYV